MTSLLAWLLDVTLGPACAVGCGHRSRGWRTDDEHLTIDHAGDPEAARILEARHTGRPS